MFDVLKEIVGLIGGVGIIAIGISKLGGVILKDRLNEKQRRNTEEQLERKKQQYLNKRIQSDRFMNTQYEVYVELWQNLQGMKLSVNALWDKANNTNIIGLSKQLRQIHEKIDNWSIFFDQDNLKDIKSLLKILDEFEIGKMNLLNLRQKSIRELPSYFSKELEEVINQNRDYKERFEKILEKIEIDFRTKLSQIV